MGVMETLGNYHGQILFSFIYGNQFNLVGEDW